MNYTLSITLWKRWYFNTFIFYFLFFFLAKRFLSDFLETSFPFDIHVFVRLKFTRVPLQKVKILHKWKCLHFLFPFFFWLQIIVLLCTHRNSNLTIYKLFKIEQKIHHFRISYLNPIGILINNNFKPSCHIRNLES